MSAIKKAIAPTGVNFSVESIWLSAITMFCSKIETGNNLLDDKNQVEK